MTIARGRPQGRAVPPICTGRAEAPSGENRLPHAPRRAAAAARSLTPTSTDRRANAVSKTEDLMLDHHIRTRSWLVDLAAVDAEMQCNALPSRSPKSTGASSSHSARSDGGRDILRDPSPRWQHASNVLVRRNLLAGARSGLISRRRSLFPLLSGHWDHTSASNTHAACEHAPSE